MGTAFISDLHGNLHALQAVLADAADHGCERIVCLGDIVDLGPQPSETIALLRDRGIPCIKGNHDPLDEHPPVPLLLECEDWTREVLSDEEHAWLTALPERLEIEEDGRKILCVHGSPRRINENTTADSNLDDVLSGEDTDVMVCGHTHVQFVRRHEGTLVVNVGSVGQPFIRPFDGRRPVLLPYADYAIVSGHGVRLRRIEYDLEGMFAAIRAHMPSPEAWVEQWRLPE